METRTCTKCGKELPATKEYFYRNKSCGTDGLHSICKKCFPNAAEKKQRCEELKNIPKRMASPGMKICTTCQGEIPADTDHFYVDRSHKDGLRSRCISCELDHRNKNRTQMLSTVKKYYLSHRLQCIASVRSAQARRVDDVRIKNIAYQNSNKKRLRGIKRRWKLDNRQHCTLEEQKRRALKHSLLSTMDEQQWEACKTYFNHSCAYCGSSNVKLAQDHVIPVIYGGPYVQSNVLPACGSCNPSKGKKNMYSWYSKQPCFTQKRLNRIIKWIGYDPREVQQYAMF